MLVKQALLTCSITNHRALEFHMFEKKKKKKRTKDESIASWTISISFSFDYYRVDQIACNTAICLIWIVIKN